MLVTPAEFILVSKGNVLSLLVAVLPDAFPQCGLVQQSVTFGRSQMAGRVRSWSWWRTPYEIAPARGFTVRRFG